MIKYTDEHVHDRKATLVWMGKEYDVEINEFNAELASYFLAGWKADCTIKFQMLPTCAMEVMNSLTNLAYYAGHSDDDENDPFNR